MYSQSYLHFNFQRNFNLFYVSGRQKPIQVRDRWERFLPFPPPLHEAPPRVSQSELGQADAARQQQNRVSLVVDNYFEPLPAAGSCYGEGNLEQSSWTPYSMWMTEGAAQLLCEALALHLYFKLIMVQLHRSALSGEFAGTTSVLFASAIISCELRKYSKLIFVK